jgi:DnaK suppressor protein
VGSLAAVADQSVTSNLRERLQAERDQLASQVAGLEPGSGASPSFDDNFADSGQVAAEQGENKVLAGQLRAELDEVEIALAKLDDGTYGACETCGQPIAPARLEAMPQARFCIDHA